MRDETTVMIVNQQNRIEFRKLQILRNERDRVLVSGGLRPGERVCVSMLEAAVDGMRVRVTGDAPSQADRASLAARARRNRL